MFVTCCFLFFVFNFGGVFERLHNNILKCCVFMTNEPYLKLFLKHFINYLKFILGITFSSYCIILISEYLNIRISCTMLYNLLMSCFILEYMTHMHFCMMMAVLQLEKAKCLTCTETIKHNYTYTRSYKI